jgi:type IV secretory pathway protease TraF
MMPTLSNGQIVIAHQIRKFKVGQVVIAHADGREVVKRIAEIKNGGVYLLGDNEKHSTDSRKYGFVSDVNIEGIVFWPKVVSSSK